MNLSAFAEQRARYSRARHGRHERGAMLAECALVEAMARVLGLRADRAGASSAPGSFWHLPVARAAVTA